MAHAARFDREPEDLSPIELDAWAMAMTHLADRGLTAIVPTVVAEALSQPRRRHLRLIPGGGES
jgi:hypothetical protein